MVAVDQLLQGQVATNVRLDSTSRDDAALYQLGDDRLLATSVDFGTPISSNPVTWGRIGTLNALSDLYAMGAMPLFALSIIGWPRTVPHGVMSELMSGVIQTLTAEDTRLLGGHTITSAVPFFGLSVTGQARSDSVMLIRNAKPHQYIVISKPLGTGAITAAQKSSTASPAAIQESERIMSISNRTVAELAVQAGIRAATDITGYGLTGHLHNMLKASGCAAYLAYDCVPIIPEARTVVSEGGIVPNSAEHTYTTLERYIDWANTPLDLRFILSDPQTSGGLLLCGGKMQMETFLAACKEAGQPAAVVGRVRPGRPGSITMTQRLPEQYLDIIQ